MPIFQTMRLARDVRAQGDGVREVNSMHGSQVEPQAIASVGQLTSFKNNRASHSANCIP